MFGGLRRESVGFKPVIRKEGIASISRKCLIFFLKKRKKKNKFSCLDSAAGGIKILSE